jgi:CheY-like chemotaxis protein/HPt (histidine-containing phosphotransfer) domain-containing protein
MRVLIAEPSHVVSLLLTGLFEKHGVAAVVASTAEEALGLLEQEPVGLLCLAYELGDMNGIDLVATARKHGLLQTQPVILFASTHDRKVIDRARRAGIAQCYSKHQKDDLDRFVAAYVADQTRSNAARVLLVEDSATNREVIEAQLKKQGVRVESVANGRQALERIAAGDPPDLVLMDCQMPVMDGYEATRRIRQWEQDGDRPRLPIVALTANASQGDRDQCVVAGMNDYLHKPIAPRALAAALARWLPGKVGADKTTALQGGRAENALLAVADGNTVPVGADQPGPQAQSIFDAASMLARFGGDREIAEIAVAGALESVPAELGGLRQACAAADAATARRHAHTIKSLAASIAAIPCSTVAAGIERQLAAGELGAARDAVPRLAASFQELSGTLQDWLSTANHV